MLYSRRKEIVQAYQIGSDSVPEWLMDEIIAHRAILDASGELTIIQRSKRYPARTGSWVLKHENGLIEVLSAEGFDEQYEPAKFSESYKNHKSDFKRPAKRTSFNPWPETKREG